MRTRSIFLCCLPVAIPARSRTNWRRSIFIVGTSDESRSSRCASWCRSLGLAAQQAHRFETKKLIAGLEACLEANVRLVSSQLDHELILTEIVVKLLAC